MQRDFHHGLLGGTGPIPINYTWGNVGHTRGGPVTHLLMAMVLLTQTAIAPESEYGQYNRVTRYDRYFSKYSKRYFGVAFDWKHFKAQAVAESRLDPDARSSAGAVGVMQVMPRTFEEIRRKNSAINGTRVQPRWSIAAGIWYDRQQFMVWTARRPLLDRIKFMFGSYNAGRGSILRAQTVAERQGLNPNLWQSIELSLLSVTGGRSRETLSYVDRIAVIKDVLR